MLVERVKAGLCDRVERWFLVGTAIFLMDVVVGVTGAGRPVLLALGTASAALMLVGFGLGMFEVFSRA